MERDNKMEGTKESCTCAECKSACECKPGWFLPGEPEKVADFLGLSLKCLFSTKLAIDWWVGTIEDTFLIAPGIVGGETGAEYPANPKGVCVFYTDGLCIIHEVKPYECKELLHAGEEIPGRHKYVAESWEDHQDEIINLLGRRPKAKAYNVFDSLFSR